MKVNDGIVRLFRLFGLFDCYWCYSSFKRRSATPRTQTQQAPAPVATDESIYQSSFNHNTTVDLQPDAQPTDQPSCLEPRQKENRIRTEKFASRRRGNQDTHSLHHALAVQVDLAFRRVECKELVGCDRRRCLLRLGAGGS